MIQPFMPDGPVIALDTGILLGFVRLDIVKAMLCLSAQGVVWANSSVYQPKCPSSKFLGQGGYQNSGEFGLDCG